MKAEIRRGRQNQGGPSEIEKKQLLHLMRRTKWKSSTKLEPAAPLDKYFLFASLKRSTGWSNPFEHRRVY